MKILFHSNAPWAPTGYGQQTALFAERLAEHYDVAISAFYGLEGARLKWHGMDVYPGITPDFGNAYLLGHAQAHFGDDKDGLLLTLMDVWVLDRDMSSKLNIASWVPVDHKPAPFNVVNFFQATGAVPIAMSRDGQEQLKAVNLDPLYVPHGVDTSVYRPQNRDAVRASVGAPKDAFLVGMVAANKGTPSRKGFQQAMEAFAVFHESHDEALLYMHTVTDGSYAQGEDILTLARALGIQDSLVVPSRYQMMYDPLPPVSMAQVFASMDVLLNPSMGEGFGIPVLEAAACGVPSIVTDITAMPEVAGPGGWKVNWRPYWTQGKAWWGVADVAEIVESLEACYSQTDEERALRSMQCRSHAMEYDVAKVLEDHWLPALEIVHQRLFDHSPSVSTSELVAK